MNGTQQNPTRVWLTLLALGLPFVLAQPGPLGVPPADAPPPPSPGAPPPPSGEPPLRLSPLNGYGGEYRAIEEAAEALEKAARNAYEVGYIAASDTQSVPHQEDLLGLAEGLLEGAEADFAAQTYFAAKERAKAAEDVYKTLEHLSRAEGRYAAEGANITIDLYATFTRAEWEAGVEDIAVSLDGSQLAYTRGSDLWVMDFVQNATPHQLTTGPVYHGGAQFSPDGTALAFAAGRRDFSTETYIIPNHRSEPLFIDCGQDAGDEYLIGENTLVDEVLAWVP